MKNFLLVGFSALAAASVSNIRELQEAGFPAIYKKGRHTRFPGKQVKSLKAKK